MSPDPLESLLEKLSRGDAAAIEQTVHAHEGYLRLMVRRQLSRCFRARFDSIDIVHSVWVRLLPGFSAGRWHFKDARELRAFLVRATRNHLINRMQHAALERAWGYAQVQSPDVARHHSEPSPDEDAAADDLWQRLVALCPPAHLELLRLKRDGVPLAQIAERTGLHPSSVRRILYDLMRRLNNKRGTDAVSVHPL
jgi:RNA polymerase sigma-70 factor (ECF subfamily)